MEKNLLPKTTILSFCNTHYFKRRFSSEWKKIENQRKYFSELSKKFQIKTLNDWYSITISDLLESEERISSFFYSIYSGTLIQIFYTTNKGSIYKALSSIYPDFNWKPWKFKNIPRSFWSQKENQKLFLDDLSLERGIDILEDGKISWKNWYSIKNSEIIEHGGNGLLHLYKGSLFDILQTNYPQFPWKIYRFKTPTLYWNSEERKREFLNDLYETLGFSKWTDWYSVTPNDIKKHGGTTLLALYKENHVEAITSILNEYPWNKELFFIREKIFRNKEEERSFLEGIGKKLGVTKIEDWYKINAKQLSAQGGATLLRHYQDAYAYVITNVFPEHNWLIWKFEQIPQNYWQELKNQRNFFDWLGKQYKIKTWEDWYKIKKNEVIENGGSGLLNCNNNSLFLSLSKAYPEYCWDSSKFQSVPDAYWKDKNIQRDFFERLGKKLGIQRMEDWKQVKASDVAKNGGVTLMNYYKGSIDAALSSVYPEYSWKSSIGIPTVSKSQSRIFQVLQEITQNQLDIHFDHQLQDARFSESNGSMQLDIFIPSLKLAIEYQGQQHFKDIRVFNSSLLSKRKELDEEKREACKKLGITLVEVPYTWDGSKQTLCELISKECAEFRSLVEL